MNEIKPQIEADDIEQRSTEGFHEVFGAEKSSALAKYQDLTVGNRGLWKLFKHELLTSVLINFPGLLGYFLRQKLYKLLFKEIGRGSVFGTGMSLRQPSRVSIGRTCIIDDMVSLSVRGGDESSLQLADGVFVGRGTMLNARECHMEIGKDVNIGVMCRISSSRGTIRIGDYGMIAAYCYIGGGNHNSDRVDIPMALQGTENLGGVIIEDDVWIGAQTIIADGVTIGKGSIIGAGSFVNKDIPEYSIAYGSPASVHKKRV